MTNQIDDAQGSTAEPVTEAVACVGAGLIGGAWAALFAARGYRVNIHDPAPDAEREIRAIVGRAAAVLDVAPGVFHARLRLANDMARAPAGVDYVQGSATDSVASKRQLLGDKIGRARGGGREGADG